jgi:hypothetical protein
LAAEPRYFCGRDTPEAVKTITSTCFKPWKNHHTTAAHRGQTHLFLYGTNRSGPAYAASRKGLKTLKVRKNALIKHYYDSAEHYADVSRPFTPMHRVLQVNYSYFGQDTPEAILEAAKTELPAFEAAHGYQPKVLVIKGIGLVAVAITRPQCYTILDVYEDALKIAWLSKSLVVLTHDPGSDRFYRQLGSGKLPPQRSRRWQRRRAVNKPSW